MGILKNWASNRRNMSKRIYERGAIYSFYWFPAARGDLLKYQCASSIRCTWVVGLCIGDSLVLAVFKTIILDGSKKKMTNLRIKTSFLACNVQHSCWYPIVTNMTNKARVHGFTSRPAALLTLKPASVCMPAPKEQNLIKQSGKKESQSRANE